MSNVPRVSRVFCWMVLAWLASLPVARAQDGEEQPAPLKVEVALPSSPQAVRHPLPLRVSLHDARGRLAPAPADVELELLIDAASGRKETHAVKVLAGQSSAELVWQPKEAGVTRVRVREVDDHLLDGNGAFLVRAAPSKPGEAREPAGVGGDSVAPRAGLPGTGGSGQPTAARGGGAGRIDERPKPRKGRHHGVEVPPPPPPPPLTSADEPPAGHLEMQVSARDIAGVFADGNEAAKVDVFYLTEDGRGAPTDVQIWFQWTGGEVTPQPLVIKKGESQAEARWVARAPVEGALSIKSVAPRHPAPTEVEKVRFVQPVKGLRIDGPLALSVVDLGEISAYFEDFDGRIIEMNLGQEVAFSTEQASLTISPATQRFTPGEALVRAALTPRAFAGSFRVHAATLGFPPQTHSVRITWLSALLLCALGGALGGLMRFLRSRGVLWKRLLVGVVVGTAGVLGYVTGLLPALKAPVLHNLLAVPVVAFLVGWLGLDFLDRIDALALLTGHDGPSVRKRSAVPAPSART